MKLIFVIKQIDRNISALSGNFLERLAEGLRKLVDDDKSVPIIALPYGYELQVINVDSSEVKEVTVRYEDANGNEISRQAVWK